MREILELFVQDMPSRVGELLGSWERQELETVGRLAHQLKGAGGGYGFQVISDVAGELEKSISALRSGGPRATAEAVKSQVDALADLCRRATAN